jgi:predicted secreted protein
MVDTAYNGRSIALLWNAVAIAGVREKSIKVDGSAVDVTSDESDGWQTLLSVAGENKVEIGLSGVTKSEALKKDWFAGTRTRAVSITYPDGGALSGQFFMANYNDKGPYKDATTFEATLMSTGAVTYTPAAT